jgi:hypothetical protein
MSDKKKTPTDEEVDRFFRELQAHAEVDLFPKLRNSRMSVSIIDQTPDVKMCMELGASMYFDKPLILIVKRGAHFIPAKLRKLADAVIEYEHDFKDPKVQAQIQEVLARLLKEEPKTQ